jgi:hypothetical protein
MKSKLWESAKKTLQNVSKIIESDPNAGPEDAAVNKLVLALKKDPDFKAWSEAAVDTKPYAFLNIGLEASEKGMPAAKEALKNLIGSLAPENFTYQGFPIENPGRMTDDHVRKLLDGIDYLVALFKKRGMEKLLKAGVTKVVLSVDDEGYERAAGLFYTQDRSIHLLSPSLKSKGKLLKNFVHEVFLHEFGHYVHMNYITGDARRFWDSAWDPISKLKSIRLDITLEDRQRYIDVIEKAGWNVSKAVKKLKGTDQVKLAYWLRQAGVGPLIGDKSLRLTELGKRYFGVLKDPMEQFISEGKDPADISDQYTASRLKAVRGNLYLDAAFTFKVPEEVAKKYVAEDPEIGDAALKKLFEDLGSPTDYAQTNEKEDFAETWVAYMDNPSQLSDNAKYRMQRTLALSGLGGKEVMRLAYEYDRRHVL